MANGLALATGDAILALRAIIHLILSCGLAISFAVVLVLILPFKEMTGEILARTQPNLLDLVIALFSGAVGIEMSSARSPSEIGSPADRAIAIRNYLETKWQIGAERYIRKTATATQPIVQLKTTLKKLPKNSSPSVLQDAVEGELTR
ncbi:DUF389 domain-containing protein [Microcoleus sp. LEGE 07076]|uniref:DUF389 domain-containing protein n=1 Tax=Microcoleus sp. LEGE 07076 TaxID=915322 RepID=UPI001D15B0EE|nr:DUF389 domain-containing protein [Microcoleus sp. LEGE 07076]